MTTEQKANIYARNLLNEFRESLNGDGESILNCALISVEHYLNELINLDADDYQNQFNEFEFYLEVKKQLTILKI